MKEKDALCKSAMSVCENPGGRWCLGLVEASYGAASPPWNAGLPRPFS